MFDSETGAAAADHRHDNVEAGALRDDTKRAPLELATGTGLVMILLVTSASGAALLGWWSVHLHSDDRQMWMVPVGLILFCTPIVACVSVLSTSGFFPGCGVGRRTALISVGGVGTGDGGMLEEVMGPSAASNGPVAPAVAPSGDVKRDNSTTA